MEEKKLGTPKVSLQFELSQSGITSLIKAEAIVEESYIVEEEVEVDDEEGGLNRTSAEDTEEGRKLDKTEKAEENLTATEGNETSEDNANATDSDTKEKPKKKTILQEKVSRIFDVSIDYSLLCTCPADSLDIRNSLLSLSHFCINSNYQGKEADP